jgi:DNA-binding PadR family transcriptional regulator
VVKDVTNDPENCDDNLKDIQFVPRGFLKLLIVRLLAKREHTGTQIMEILEERSQGKWRPSPGSIYPLLSSLEEDGLIKTVRTEGRSKIYTLSEKGHDHFKETFRRKFDVEGRTRTHRGVWMQMLDPVDQALFHSHGIQMAISHLHDVHTQLTESQKQKLKTRLAKTRDLLDELINSIGD